MRGNGPPSGRSCPEFETSQLRAGLLLLLATYLTQGNAMVGRGDTVVIACYLKVHCRGYLYKRSSPR